MDSGEGVSGPEAKKSQKNLEKVSRGWVAKVEKKSGKSKKSENAFVETFRTFFETFFGLLGPGPGRLFETFLETFWLFAPRLPLPGPRNIEKRLKPTQLSII